MAAGGDEEAINHLKSDSDEGFQTVYGVRENFKLYGLEGTLYELYCGGPSGGLFINADDVYEWHCKGMENPSLKKLDIKKQFVEWRGEVGGPEGMSVKY